MSTQVQIPVHADGHEPMSYKDQWKEDFTYKGFRKNIGSIIPSGHDLKAQGKVLYNVFIVGAYHLGKFCFSKHA